MPENELYKITAKLQQSAVQPNTPKINPALAGMKDLAPTKTAEGLDVYRPVEYNVPITSIYDRLSDGTYIAKFENYQGATGNEERLARQQSSAEKWGHGLQKFAAKSVGYAVDSIVGTAYGLGAAIGQGDLSKIYDNDFANAMDDWNKTLDNKIPNYYTEEEKSKDILSSLGTANFWANDVLGGLAFVTGAVLPTVAIGALTGGATAAGTLGAAGLKSGLKKGLKEGVEETLEAGAKRSILGKVSDVTGYTQGRALTKGYFQQKLGSKLGSVVDTGAFIARTASFEAGMEARQNYKESVEDYYNSYNETNGHLPSYDEAKSFLSDARSASNSVYGANMALLTASNAVMFGKKIVPDAVTNYFGKVSGFAEKAIGLGKKAEMVEGKLVYKALTATKAQKLLGNVYKIGKKPITEGIYEEGLQGVAGKTMQNYLEAKYDPTNTQAYSSWSAFHDALTEQYSSKDGWKEMGIGILIGLVGGGVSPQAIKAGTAFGGFGNDSRIAASKQVEEDVAKLNKGIETFANMNRTSAVQAMAAAKKSKYTDINTKTFEDTLEHKAFIQSQLGINTPSEMRRDHDKIIDAQIIDDTHNIEIHSALQEANVTVEQYKTALKNDFKTNLDAFEKGKKRADNLELGRRLKGESAGNIAEIHDAIITHSMLGEGALSAAEKASQQLDAIIGETGIFSSEKFYNGLSEEKKQKIAQLKANETKLTKLKADAIKYGQALSGIPVKGVNETEIGKLDAKRKALSQKAVVTQSMITDLEQEKGRLEEAIGSDFTVSDYDVEIPGEGVKNTSIVSSMEQLDKVEKLIKSLRLAGKNHEANTIQYLQTTVRAHLDAHRETVQAYRGMLETDFFSKKEGKHFLSKVLGKKYETSQEFKDIVKENNEYIDRSLNLAGIRGYETVEGKINAAIAENPQLSDREKYRLESLIRMQATRTAAEHIAQTLSETYTQVAPERVSTKKYTIAGDSVQLTKAVDLTNLTNVEALETAIKDITEQLDYVVNRETKNADEIANLNNQITKLKQQRDAIKEKQQQEKISREQGGINEREGISEGELKEEPIQETSDEADNRNRLITSQAKQEIEKRRQEELREKSFNIEATRTEYKLEDGRTIQISTYENGSYKIFSLKEGEIPVQIAEGKDSNELTKEYLEDIYGENFPNGLDKPIKTGQKDKINAKYDAELAALEQQAVPSSTEAENITSQAKQEIEKRRQEELNTQLLSLENELKAITGNTPMDKLDRGDIQNTINSIKAELNSTTPVKIPDSLTDLVVPTIIHGKEQTVFTTKSLDRNVVFVEIDGKRYGFYQSTEGTDGKTKNHWYPFYGKASGWVVKDGGGQNWKYNTQASPELQAKLEESANKLNAEYGNEHLKSVPYIHDASETETNNLIGSHITNANQNLLNSNTEEYNRIKKKTAEEGFKSTVVMPTKGGSTETTSSQVQAEEVMPSEEPTIVVAPTLEETLANRLNTIEEKIVSAEQNLDKLNKDTFRIINSEDYIKYTALLKKQNTKRGLNKSEQVELTNLQQDLDQWTYITGSVVDGFRLSELMQQKSVLENTLIEDVVDLVVPVTQDTLAIVDIQDAETKANYSFTQAYHKVLAGRDGNVVTLYHINEVALDDEISEVVDIDGNKIVRYNAQGDPLFNRDERNNIIFTEEEVAAINEQSNLSILSTNEKFDTKYPVVLKKSISPSGETTTKPLETSFSQEFNNGQGHSIPDIYAAEKGNRLTVSLNLSDQYNRSLLAAYKNSVKDVKAKKTMQEAKNILKKGLLFTVKDSKGNVVGSLKGINNSVKNETTDISFEAMRNAIIDNETQFKEILAGGVKGEISVKVQDNNGNFIEPNITVKEVLLGQPNYNYTDTTDGTPSVEFRQPTKEQAKKVVAIGYVQEGKTFTNDHKTVNTIFLRKLSQTNPTTKIPFIVLEVGAQRFAYPVKVAVQEGAGLDEFEAIYNADTLAIDKVTALNRFMASKGIDIKISGNAFVTFGDTNLTDEFFNEKLAQLKAINYFYNVEEWINPETDMQQVVENQISVDIDLVNPLHSPKLSIDLSKLRVKGIEYDDSQEEGEEITAELVEVPLTVDEILACKK